MGSWCWRGAERRWAGRKKPQLTATTEDRAAERLFADPENFSTLKRRCDVVRQLTGSLLNAVPAGLDPERIQVLDMELKVFLAATQAHKKATEALAGLEGREDADPAELAAAREAKDASGRRLDSLRLSNAVGFQETLFATAVCHPGEELSDRMLVTLIAQRLRRSGLVQEGGVLKDAAQGLADGRKREIGRASCGERVEISVGAVS